MVPDPVVGSNGHGAPLPPSPDSILWNQWIKRLHQRIKTKRDTVIIIQGPEGEGKSAFGFLLSNVLAKKWDWRRNTVIDWNDWATTSGTTNSVVFYPELMNLAFNRDWNQASNKKLMQVFRMNRQEHNIHIGCLPDFNNLDKIFRDNRCHYKVNIIHRGMARVYERQSWTDYQGNIDNRWFSIIDQLSYPLHPKWASFEKWERMKKAGTIKEKRRRIQEETDQDVSTSALESRREDLPSVAEVRAQVVAGLTRAGVKVGTWPQSPSKETK